MFANLMLAALTGSLVYWAGIEPRWSIVVAWAVFRLETLMTMLYVLTGAVHQQALVDSQRYVHEKEAYEAHVAQLAANN